MRIGILNFAVVAILAGCSSKKEQPAPPVPVKTSPVTLQDVRQTWLYSGEVRPESEVKLAFKQSGYVASLLKVRGDYGRLRDVQEGDRVPARTVLATLQTGELEASLQSAEGQAVTAKGQLDAAHADLKEAKADQHKADLQFERAQGLYATKAMTRPDYDSAVQQHQDGVAKTESSIKQIEAQGGQLESAQARIKTAKINLSQANLLTPKPSVIVSKDVEVGALVSAGTNAFTVADTRTMNVEFGVPDSILPQFTMGQPVQVSVDGLERRFAGRVTEIAGSASSDSRVFNIKVSLPNGDAALKVGMIASVKIEQEGAGRQLPVLPVTALISAQSGLNSYSVFVVSDEGSRQVAHLRSVRTGQIFERSVVIEEGLYEGERVILDRTNQLADGSVVRVVN